MTPDKETLPDAHLWLRVSDMTWKDPLDPSFAAEHGGRWNPPRSFPTLYLNEDLATARLQIEALLDGYPVRPDDLEDGFDLVVATLPRSQEVADAVSDEGLVALGLPATYPQHANGKDVQHETCQPVGAEVRQLGLRGVRSRSAIGIDGRGRELAWFPARPSSRASLEKRISFREWWTAEGV